MPKKIFITGSTGCIGHYVLDQFANRDQFQLYLLIRDKTRFRINIEEIRNVILVFGDMEHIDTHKEILAEMNYVIHIATQWGGDQDIVVDAPLRMLAYLDFKKIEKVIFFSTASVLDNQNKILPEAESLGTGYVRAKQRSYLAIQKSPYKEKVTHVFATVVLGGDKNHPFSHISEGLLAARRNLWWLKWVYVDFGFHFIHAVDIAKIVFHLTTQPNSEKDIVMGNQYILFKDFVKAALKFYRKFQLFALEIPDGVLKKVIRIFKINVDQWGYFCWQYRYFKYKTTSCRDLKIPTELFSVEQILARLENDR